MKSPKLSDLRHIVPASQPAWVRLVEACTFHESEGETHEWQDAVWPVLAYACLPDGIGAYLTVTDSSGPCWFVREVTDSPDRSVWIELHYLNEPTRGTPPEGLDPKFEYDPSAISEAWGLVDWLIA